MPLLNGRYSDPDSAALSVAANRASKIRLLRADAAKLDNQTSTEAYSLRAAANHSEDNLRRDVAHWIASTAAGKRAQWGTVMRLFQIAGATGEGAPCPNCGGPEGYPSGHAVGCPERVR